MIQLIYFVQFKRNTPPHTHTPLALFSSSSVSPVVKIMFREWSSVGLSVFHCLNVKKRCETYMMILNIFWAFIFIISCVQLVWHFHNICLCYFFSAMLWAQELEQNPPLQFFWRITFILWWNITDETTILMPNAFSRLIRSALDSLMRVCYCLQ